MCWVRTIGLQRRRTGWGAGMGRREDLMDLERLEVGSTLSKLKGLVCLRKKGLFDGKFGYAAQARKAPDRLGQCKSPMAGLTVTTACMPFLLWKA